MHVWVGLILGRDSGKQEHNYHELGKRKKDRRVHAAYFSLSAQSLRQLPCCFWPGKITCAHLTHLYTTGPPPQSGLYTTETERVPASSLSSQIERAGTLLQSGALEQVESYRARFEAVEGLYERLFKNLIKSDFDPASAYETAKKFFGTDTVPFAAVDGTEYSKPLFDLVVFLGGSYASRGTIKFDPEKAPSLDYEEQFLKTGRGLSSCVPVYVNEVPEIDLSFLQPGESTEMSLERPLTDEAIVDNSTIPMWIMAFSEYYLAFKLASEQGGPRIIFLDRSLATSIASLIYATSKRKLWKSNGSLYGLKVNGVPIDMNDLAYGRHHFGNPSLDLPPARGDYLRYRCWLTLEHNGPQTLDSLCTLLKITRADQRKRVDRILLRSRDEGFLEELLGTYGLKQRYSTTWARIKTLVETIGRRMFEEKSPRNPMRVEKNNEWHWLTTQDLAFLTLFALNLLLEECWRNQILLIGLTKDTAARDLKNHVLPVLSSAGIWPSDITQEDLTRIPNTDRMMLQTLSVFNHQSMKVPWALTEYDSAFLMIIPDLGKQQGFVSGAIRNKITPERLFLKSYIQLCQANVDPQLRSNVLLLDRLSYPDYDFRPDSTLEFKHNYGSAEERVRPIVYQSKTVRNPIQELVMQILSSMTSNSIPDLFGHNKPLYIADKVAKWHNEEIRRIIDTTGKWLMNNPGLRQFVFYMSTFRERRGEVESSRRERI